MITRIRHESPTRLLPTLLLVLASCGEGPAPGWSDYAGLTMQGLSGEVMVVDQVLPVWSGEHAWRVETEPVVRIGVTDGASEYQFHGIAGAIRLGDGRILVADAGSHQLRLFGPDGRHLRSVGGHGAGPGEFEDISWMAPGPDGSVILWDGALARGSQFNAEGELARTFSLPRVPDYPLLHAEHAFADGSILAQAGPPREVTDAAGSLWRVVGAYRLMGVGSRQAESMFLGEFPSHYVPNERCEGEGDCSPEFRGIWAKWWTSGDRLIYARGDLPEVLVVDPGEGTARVFRRGGQQEARTSPAGAAVPPFYDALQTDESGSIWARMHGTDTWSLFDPVGRWLGDLDLPPGLHLHHVASEYVVGSQRDELGVERVVVHRLHAPPA